MVYQLKTVEPESLALRLQNLKEENELLRRELKVAREAADITAELVVRQFEKTEQMLNRYQIANAERQAVLDAATKLSIISTDLNGEIKLFSRGAELMLGYSAREMIGRRNILSLHLKNELEELHNEDNTQTNDLGSMVRLFARLARQAETAARQWHYRRKDQTLLPVALSVTALRDRDNQMQGYLFTAMNMSARNRLEIELRRAKEEAESANAAKSDFLARMSHEIRTPINGIIGMSRLLQKTKLASQQQDYLNKVLNSAGTLLRLINDLLDFSRIDAGQLQLEQIPFSLDKILENLANNIALEADKKGLELIFQPDPNLPERLIGDPLRLEQVLLNLLNNAVKFTNQGEIILTITRNKDPEEGKLDLSFTVSDSGIGLPEERIEQLFATFSQADDSTARKYGGSGLGLAICRQLVELMDGNIKARNRPTGGAEFTFNIVLTPSRTNRKSTWSAFSCTNNLKALIADDHPLARETLRIFLEQSGMVVTATDSGNSLLETIAGKKSHEQLFDLVILDWQMPGLDGLETARRIRNHSQMQRVPILLMITAECQENIRYKAKAIGIDGVLPKPIRISLLYETLSPLLSWTAEFSHPENDIATQTIFDHERLNDKRVLLIEDNPVNQEVAISMMEEVGIIVEIAENGRDGVEAALSKPFDLVLMDIQMPGMDGFTATRLIRRHIKQETLPIVAMTANAMRKDREKSLTAGMNEHLNKPVEANELYRILCQQLTLDRRPESTTSTQQQQPLVLRPLSSTAKKISWPQLPGIELERANLKLGNRPRLLLKLLASFRREHADNPQHLREWTATGNWQKIRQLLHTLQGVIKLIGAFELGREAAVLERQLHSGKLLDSSFKTKIENFSQRLEDLLRALEKIIPADREKPITTVTPTDNTLPADCRKLKKILQTLKTKLDQGELIDDELLDDLRQGARCPRFSPQAEEISAQIEDLELEAAGSLTSRLLADLEIAERE